MKIAVVGSRDFPYLHWVEATVKLLPPNTIVVSGGARGVDTTAEETARGICLPEPLIFLPDYNQYGRYQAPKIRNKLIVNAADKVIAFWHRNSGGTKDSVEYAKNQGKPLLTFRSDQSPRNGISRVPEVLEFLGLNTIQGAL